MQPTANSQNRASLTHDTELLTLYVREGNEAALERLIHRHSPMVFSVCLRLLRRHEDAEDVFQAVFVLLVRKSPRLVRHRSVAGWLHETAVRTCRQVRRQRARKRELAMTAEPAQTTEPWQSICKAHSLEALHEEIDRLPPKYRDVVIFYHLEGMSRAQIASLLDCTTASVKAALMRARKQLRQRLLHRGVTASAVLAVATTHSRQAQSATIPTELIHATLEHCRGELPTVDVGNGPAFVESLLAKETNMLLSRLALIAPVSMGALVLAAAGIAPAVGGPPSTASGATGAIQVVQESVSAADAGTPVTTVVTQIAQTSPVDAAAVATPARTGKPHRAAVAKRAVPVTVSGSPILTRVLRMGDDQSIKVETVNVVTTTAVTIVPSQVTVQENGQSTVRTEQRRQTVTTSKVDLRQPTKLIPLADGTKFESVSGQSISEEEVKSRIGSGKLTVIVLGKQEPLKESWKSLLRSDALVLREPRNRPGATYAHPVPVQRHVAY